MYSNYVPEEQAQQRLEADMRDHPKTAAATVYVCRSEGIYFFTTGSLFAYWDYLKKRGFTPITFAMPHMVVARPGVEDGIVDDIAKLKSVYLRGMVEVDPFRKWPELVQED